MSGAVSWARRRFRDVPLARGTAIRLHALRNQPPARDGILIVFYHDMHARDRAAFARQLRQMRDFGDIVSLADALQRLAAGAADERCICLTFDDGRKGAFDHAFPVLADQGVPATFFVVPGWIDEARPGIFGWDECRQLVSGGMGVGSHGLTHRRFATLDQVAAEQELAASRARIEAALGQPCNHFACPWGQPGEDYEVGRDPRLARAAGYDCFLTTISQRAAARSDPWTLPRVRMEPGWGAAELRYALSRPLAKTVVEAYTG